MTDNRDMVPAGGKRMTAAERRKAEEAREIKALVSDRIGRIEAMMPTHIGPWLKQANISPDVFLASYRLAMAKNPEIARCTPVSLMLALMDSAKIALPPDGKKAAIVPYKGEATFVPMRDGIVDVMGRSGYHVSAQVIYEGEDDPEILDYDLGSDPFVRFKPPLNRDDSAKVIGAFAVVTSKNGNGKWVELCSEKDLVKIRRMSKTDKVRKAWPGEMDRKAPLRRVAKFLPSTPELEILNAIETKAYLSAPAVEATINRLSDDELLDDAATAGRGPLIEHDEPEEEEQDENLSLIHRYTEMLTTAPDAEALDDRAQWVLDQVEYEALAPEEKAIFEMTLRVRREEFGVEPEAQVHHDADPRPSEDETVAIVEEIDDQDDFVCVALVEHKTGKTVKVETGAEFQAFMLETLAKGDSTSLHHWWEANRKANDAAEQIWPDHWNRVQLIAQDKGLTVKA